MCRNITTLRGLEPPATDAEITAAALQFVRKVSGLSTVSDRNADAVARAVEQIATVTSQLLDDLPARRNPPTTVPPLRRPEVQAREAARAARRAGGR
jgi:hypothetical protein